MDKLFSRPAKRALLLAGKVAMACIERARKQTVTLHSAPVGNEQYRYEQGEMHLKAHIN